MSTMIQASCATQLWLIRHPNPVTRAMLFGFYFLDYQLYTKQGGMNFMSARRKAVGSNFAAMGKIFVTDYAEVQPIVAGPQKRTWMFGTGRLIEKRCPRDFLLALSDSPHEGGETHKNVFDLVWTQLALPAQGRLGNPTLIGHIDAFVRENRGRPQAEWSVPLRTMVTRFMFGALFDLDLTTAQVKLVSDLFFGGLRDNYIPSIMQGLALPSFLLRKMSSNKAELVKLIADSAPLRAYEPSSATDNLTREEYAEILMAIVGLAAIHGGTALSTAVLTGVPDDATLDLEDDGAVLRAVLEVARIQPPVNNVNTVLPEDTDMCVGKQTVNIPAGTVVAGSIGMAGLDPEQYPKPDHYDPDRPSLADTVLNWNAVGFDPVSNGYRACPGRNVAMQMAKELLIRWRQAV